MRITKSLTTQLIALSLAVLITMIGLALPQSTIAQETESQSQVSAAELEGFRVATSRSNSVETRTKEGPDQKTQSPAASREDANHMVAPVNDNHANALDLNDPNNFTNVSTVDSTVQPGEPNVLPAQKTVWYRWQAPSNLSMTFETFTNGSPLTDTVIGVYTGAAVNSLTERGYNDDINGAQNRFSRVTLIVNGGTVYYIQVRGGGDSEGSFFLRWQVNRAESSKQVHFDGYQSNYAVFRPSNGYWYIRSGLNGDLLAQPWGLSNDVLYPGDFDGDGKTDISVWRPSHGTAYVLRSQDGTLLQVQWGQAVDFTVQGDFDGDDKADFAVWRPSNGTFYVRKSTDGQLLLKQFGQIGDYPTCGDYDGDGKTDFAVVRSNTGYYVFYILKSSNNQVTGQQFGYFADNIVPGDYDGDGKNDIAVYRPLNNTFYALRSSSGTVLTVPWGAPGDIIAPGDYVGDFKTDVTVFRPSTGTFYSYHAAQNSLVVMPWGANGDMPIARSSVH